MSLSTEDIMVSIITPCYNSSPFIRSCINSVLEQSYPDWELLLVDDCSTDNTADIIQEYCRKDSRVRYLKTSEPSGSPCLPRNIGIEHACGRYIAFLDSDDMWLPTKLEEQIGLFEDKKTAIVYSDYEKISEAGKRSGRRIQAPKGATYHFLLKGNVIGNLTGVYDTAKVGKVYFQKIHHEDYVLWLSILKQGYMAKSTGTVTALYRIRSQSVSSNKWKVLAWQWKIYREIEKINCLKSLWYFCNYAVKAYQKARK